MTRSCSIRGCKSESYSGCGMSFFGFPKDKKIQKIWIQACNRPGWTMTKNSMICSLHFDGSQFKSGSSYLTSRKCLKEDAIPTRHLLNIVQHTKPSFQFKVLPGIVGTGGANIISVCGQISKNENSDADLSCDSIAEEYLEEEYLIDSEDEEVTKEKHSELDEALPNEKNSDFEDDLAEETFSKEYKDECMAVDSEEETINEADTDFRDDSESEEDTKGHSDSEDSEKEIRNAKSFDFEKLIDKKIKVNVPLCKPPDSMEDSVLLADDPIQNSPGVLEQTQTTRKAGLWLEVCPIISKRQMKYTSDQSKLSEVLLNKEVWEKNRAATVERKLRERLVVQKKKIRACNAKIRRLTKKVELYKKVIDKMLYDRKNSL